ncbi:MAG: hypothetical protein WBL63_21345 [Candidatus Acidiferrum sp.]
MGPYDEETERYLKEFRPKEIRELEFTPQPRTTLWRRLAAAAAVAVCTGGLIWFAHRELTRSKEVANVQVPNVGVASQRQYPTTLALTMLALADNHKFEALLTEESRKSLPRFQGEQSTLKVLAKD